MLLRNELKTGKTKPSQVILTFRKDIKIWNYICRFPTFIILIKTAQADNLVHENDYLLEITGL